MKKNLKKVNLELFATLAKMSDSNLLTGLWKYLSQSYYKKEETKATNDYLLCKGDIPVMLIAHVDTVFPKLPTEIYYDEEKSVMWSPQGLGADDRAGIFAILNILSKGYKPYLCFTNDEEAGGLGANALVRAYPEDRFNLKYIIELDRRGEKDCVFYRCDNENFIEYVESFDFVLNWGTFTDISIICPQWKVAGVNLSVGYFNEHSFVETLNFDYLFNTIEKVCKMLDDVNNIEKFEYVEDFQESIISSLYRRDLQLLNRQNLYLCDCCHKTYGEDDILPVRKQGGGSGYSYYCIDCLSDKINWCDECGQPFEYRNENDKICDNCLKRMGMKK